MVEVRFTDQSVSDGSIADKITRYDELATHDSMVRAIAIMKARGGYKPNEYVNEEKFPPLTVDEYLEMLAIGERIARYYRHPSQVHTAVKAGATLEQIAEATGITTEAARASYREWVEGQHRLYTDIGIGMDDQEYAESMRLVA